MQLLQSEQESVLLMVMRSKAGRVAPTDLASIPSRIPSNPYPFGPMNPVIPIRSSAASSGQPTA